MAGNSASASTPLPSDEVALGSKQTIMTEFVIAITAFCSLIFIFCVAFVFLFAYCKRIHRKEEEEEGEYIGDEESLPGSQQSNNYPRKNIQGHPQNQPQGHPQGHLQGHRPGHSNHVLSVWDTYPLYYVRERSVAESFWETEAVRNPMHREPAVIY
ncbi:uncharacterized protein LOC582888 [Strongylocentrotus purpuratus]|uniref:Uncharacterized protein n=1 Tax=Strongylocentrotus purpuratus TaxID=7668 RepID=A0A7M7SZ74_STRPU|nr:uncharacterized protein LOC582888 [Strongylocentrotus purpuratus]